MSALLDRVEYVRVDLERPGPRRGGLAGRGWRSLAATLRLAIGVALCAGPWTAVLVVGWTFRMMRRRILRGWWDRSPRRDEGDFDDWAASLPVDVPSRALPGWFVADRPLERLARPRPDGGAPSRLRRCLRLPAVALGSLWANLRAGAAAIACTYVLTMPPCFLWLGSWYDGWNTSFTKGYEQAFVGVQAALFAHALFIAAMLYVPMAWAHLAATGRARSFFDFGLVGRLIWRSGAASLLTVAAVAAALGAPVMALRALPFTFGLDGRWADAEPAEVLRFAERFELAAGLYLFAAFVGLHLLAARVYRGAMLRALRRSPRLADRLPADLRSVLDHLRLVPVGPSRSHPLLRAGRSGARIALNAAAALGAALLWFAVIAEIYVAQFFNHIPRAGWLNQPLLHLPALQTTPLLGP